MSKSAFDLDHQNQSVDGKIVVALERISEAFRVLLWNEGKNHTLSPIQVQILIFLVYHSELKSTISYLADEFNMTKATISDSVKSLISKKLIKKEVDTNDTRSFTISLTQEGQVMAKKVANFASQLEKPLDKISTQQKNAILSGLLNLITDLNKAGVISIQRMCKNCANFDTKNGKNYCKLLQTVLFDHTLRVDCPEHEAVVD